MNLRIFLFSFILFSLPVVSEAARYDVGVWVPWFAEETGAESALENIDKIDVLYPFVFEVTDNGDLINRVDFEDRHWDDLFDEAEDERVDVIPTIAWFNGPAIHAVLSDRDRREDHIDDIVRMVRRGGFNGVNIDYETKLAETIDHFSDFLEELKDELGRRRELTCTVEARTPPESRFREVPRVIQYSNDYQELNQHCDWVEIMAYDQQRADWRLNQERRGVPYNPVADTDWVEKVLDFALEDFDEDKVMLGVATYGRAWDVTVAADWYKEYDLVATLNEPRILELAEKYDVRPGRTEGGEAVITYFPEDSVWRIFEALPTPEGTPRGFEAAAKALLVATYADVEIPVRMITWSDVDSIKEKLELVEEYDLRGVAVFKVDGEEGRDFWRLLR